MTKTILWRRLDLPGHEACTVGTHEGGWRLAGTAVFAHDDVPCELRYRVLCAPGWVTTSANIVGCVGNCKVDLDISTDGMGQWHVNGMACPAVTGCIDLDLGFSPSTNLLPIRRLSLEPGESAEVVAAWLPFPSLAFEPLPQVYRREGKRMYRYASRGGAFVRTLEVDDVGFVTHYPGLWKAVSATSSGGTAR